MELRRGIGWELEAGVHAGAIASLRERAKGATPNETEEYVWLESSDAERCSNLYKPTVHPTYIIRLRRCIASNRKGKLSWPPM